MRRRIRKEIRRAVRYQLHSEMLEQARLLQARSPFPANDERSRTWHDEAAFFIDMVSRVRARASASVCDKCGSRRRSRAEIGIATTHDLAG